MLSVLFIAALLDVLLLGAAWQYAGAATAPNASSVAATTLLVVPAALLLPEPQAPRWLLEAALAAACSGSFLKHCLAFLQAGAPGRSQHPYLGTVIALIGIISLVMVIKWPTSNLSLARNLLVLLPTCALPAIGFWWSRSSPAHSTMLILIASGMFPGAYALLSLAGALDRDSATALTSEGLVTAYALASIVLALGTWSTQFLAHQRSSARSSDDFSTSFSQAERQWTADILLRYLIHEVSQPLTAALNNLQLIQLRVSTSAQDVVALCADADRTQRALLQIQSVLGRLRGQVADSREERQEFGLSEIVGEVVGLLAYECRLQGVDLLFIPAREPDRICCDGVAVRQIVWNLMRNAFEAVAAKTTPAAVCCEVEVRGHEAYLSVSDSGGGVPKAVLENSVGTTTSSGEGHFGIGLAIVKRLALRNGARFELAMEADDPRVQFHIVFPLVKSEISP